jgi:EAL and modified HD-GYP domain-containing signal transduction protein
MLVSVTPMFDSRMAVQAYYFIVRKANNLVLDAQSSKVLDGVLNSLSLNVINSVGLDALTSGNPVFIPIHPIAMFADLSVQCTEPPEKIIFTLDNSMEPTELYITKMKELIEKGYSFALQGVKNYDYYADVLPYIKYIFLNNRNTDVKAISAHLSEHYPWLLFIVSKINTSDDFDRVRYGKYTMFEGKFYRLPLSQGSFAINPLKVNYIQLLNIVNDDNFDISAVANVVQQDTALAISLLRMVNKIGLESEIKSINHAAAMLGQSELRRWITTAVADKLYSDKPDEITRLSLLRAKFAENSADFFGMTAQSKDLYLMGLFSVLDIILEMPIAQALDLVKVPDAVHEALVAGTGKYINVLDFIKAYEGADWQEVSRIVILHEIDEEMLYKAFVDAAMWYGKLIGRDEG